MMPLFTIELVGFTSQLFFIKKLIQRIFPCRHTSGYFLHREFLFNVVTIKAPGRPRTAEPAPNVLADAAVLERAAGVELYLQHACSRVVADGAQLAGIDLFHFHDSGVPVVIYLDHTTLPLTE